ERRVAAEAVEAIGIARAAVGRLVAGQLVLVHHVLLHGHALERARIAHAAILDAAIAGCARLGAARLGGNRQAARGQRNRADQRDGRVEVRRLEDDRGRLRHDLLGDGVPVLARLVDGVDVEVVLATCELDRHAAGRNAILVRAATTAGRQRLVAGRAAG